jgi:glycosyltransferase involved in cell wall biosynthesis
LPIIASRVGGLVESVEDQATGYLVQPRDVAALAAALRRLLADPARARAMGAAGRKHVLSTFDWEIVGRKFAEIVEAVIAPPTR